MDDIFIEIKWATRFDSPSCLDTYDHQHSISEEGKTLYVEAMCRNDKVLMKYRLELDLF